MVGRIFYWVLNMSLGASIAGMVAWLVGRIPRLPRSVACILWALPLLRLLVPVAPVSRFSLMQLLVRLGSRPVPMPEGNPGMTAMNFTQGACGYFPLVYRTAALKAVFGFAGIVWVLGAAAMLLAVALSYRRAMGAAARARWLREELYVSDRVSVPAVYGILRPRILVPGDCSPELLEYALAHERCHIRRRDNLWRLVAVCAACVHWFNPLVWLGLGVFLQEMELACDEAVLRGCTGEGKKAYALALIRWAVRPEKLVSAFGGPDMKTRIGRILSYRRLSRGAWLASGLLAAVIGMVLLTNGG